MTVAAMVGTETAIISNATNSAIIFFSHDEIHALPMYTAFLYKILHHQTNPCKVT